MLSAGLAKGFAKFGFGDGLASQPDRPKGRKGDHPPAAVPERMRRQSSEDESADALSKNKKRSGTTMGRTMKSSDAKTSGGRRIL